MDQHNVKCACSWAVTYPLQACTWSLDRDIHSEAIWYPEVCPHSKISSKIRQSFDENPLLRIKYIVRLVGSSCHLILGVFHPRCRTSRRYWGNLSAPSCFWVACLFLMGSIEAVFYVPVWLRSYFDLTFQWFHGVRSMMNSFSIRNGGLRGAGVGGILGKYFEFVIVRWPGA